MAFWLSNQKEAAELQEKAKAVFDMETQQKADIESGKGLSKPWAGRKIKRTKL